VRERGRVQGGRLEGTVLDLKSLNELKRRQRRAWDSAPLERVPLSEAAIHDELVAHLSVRPGERWLDVATGTGPVALRAARLGADVTGQDLAPQLVQLASAAAAQEHLPVRFDVGDAEHLPYPNASFDVVTSAEGAIFAPDHAAVARELARVCRPGGRLGLTSWRPWGRVGDFVGLLRRFGPPQQPNAGDFLDWGQEEYVSELLGGAFALSCSDGDAPLHGASGEALWELLSTDVGPVKSLISSLSPDRREDLHRAAVRFFESHRTTQGIVMPREYLLVVGRRRG
jgi:ubiquinone/menaquinone biosynthesis C-methylase UbiE